MFRPPVRPPLLLKCLSRQVSTTPSAVELYEETLETSSRKQRGPPQGSHFPQTNWRPRGKTVMRAIDKTESDKIGKMVHRDVKLDFDGFPTEIPAVHWMRMPTIKTEPESYEDWRRRKGTPWRWLEGSNNSIQKLELEVGRMMWEMKLAKRPPVDQEKLAFNKKLTEILGELRDRALTAKLSWKVWSYDRAIRSITMHHELLTSGEQARKLVGVGPKIADKIQEIIETGTLRQLEDDTEDKKAAAMNLFPRIPGFGHIEARHFVDRGILTLEDLRRLDESELTPTQKIGLKYFEELDLMIPREEMQVWETTILAAIELVDSDFQATIVGPHRRGAPESPEIDVLLTHPDYAKAIPDILRGSIADKHLLRSVIDKLHSSGHLTDETVFQVNRYDGIGQLPVSRDDETKPSPHRRIKFRFVAWDSFVFSQLYFTGTDAFIIHCREQAAKRGYRLSFDCLEKRIKTTMEVFGVDGLKYMFKDEKDDVKEGRMVTVDSEEDLFAFLRMKYVPPHERNWY